MYIFGNIKPRVTAPNFTKFTHSVSRDIAMETNFGIKIGKIGLFTFIRSLGIPKQITISLFWF